MSLGSSRKFNGGQSVEGRGRGERKREEQPNRFPRRQWLRSSFSSLKLRNVLAFAGGSHCSLRLHLLSKLLQQQRKISNGHRRHSALLRCSFFAARSSIRRPKTPSNLYLAYTSTGRQKHSRAGDDSQTSEARRPPFPFSFPGSRFFFCPSQSVFDRVKMENPIWNIKK